MNMQPNVVELECAFWVHSQEDGQIPTHYPTYMYAWMGEVGHYTLTGAVLAIAQ